MVLVFRFRAWDDAFNAWVIFPVKTTVERVAAMGGMIVAGTGEYVDPAALDEIGMYHMPRRTAEVIEQRAPQELQNPKPRRVASRAISPLAFAPVREPDGWRSPEAVRRASGG